MKSLYQLCTNASLFSHGGNRIFKKLRKDKTKNQPSLISLPLIYKVYGSRLIIIPSFPTVWVLVGEANAAPLRCPSKTTLYLPVEARTLEKTTSSMCQISVLLRIDIQ